MASESSGTWQDYGVDQAVDMQQKGVRGSGLPCTPCSWVHHGLPPAIRENWELLWVSWESGPSSPRCPVFRLRRWPKGSGELDSVSLSLGGHCCASPLVQGCHPVVTFHHSSKNPCYLMLSQSLASCLSRLTLSWLILSILVEYFLQ